MKKATVPVTPVPVVKPDATLKIEETAGVVESEPSSKGRVLFMVGVMVGVVVVGISGGLLLINRRERQQVAVEKAQSNVTAVLTPTPVLFSRSEWLFEVLNGSGVAGRAAAAAKQLSAMGYTVVNIGNAEEKVNGNQLFVQKASVEKAVLLIDDLGEDFGITAVAGELTDSTASARLVVGL